MFKIPIKEYEKDIDTESSKEILDLLINSNNLRSKEEFKRIENKLHDACKEGNIELIKIYLGETVENDSKDLTLKIDKTSCTASLIHIKNDIEEFIIPRTIQYKSVDYLITSIIFTCDNIKKINFCDDSAVKTICKDALSFNIKEIYFPPSLKELEKGWDNYTHNLTKITVSPFNDQFIFNDDKYLLGKSDVNNDEFDILLFVRRDIKEISIPSNIRIISSNAFNYCLNLTKVEIPPDSNLQIIESSFSGSKIKEIFIPSKVIKICEYVFSFENLTKVEIPSNSNLQIIERYAFAESNIKEIFIPSTVTKICEKAFYNCFNLTKIEIPPNSNLQTIESYAFACSNIEEIFIPSNLKELKEGWCFSTENLTKIKISPYNDKFIMKDDKYLLCKSDESNDEFDVLLFVPHGIKEISIPSNIKTISSYAFSCFENLTKVEFPRNSNLQTIEMGAFSASNIKEIFIPSKVTKICENAFSSCVNLTKVEIPPNSNLQTIESDAFLWTKIKCIFIPSKVSKINQGAFFRCFFLQIVEISEESILETFLLSAFPVNPEIIFMIPSSLKSRSEFFLSEPMKIDKM